MAVWTVTEYGTLRSVPLADDEVNALRRYGQQLEIAGALDGDGYDLTAGCWVGTIQVGQTAIEIRPKLPVAQVMFLLMYATDPKAWRPEPFPYDPTATLLEALVPGFITHVERAIGRGLLQGYRRREDSLQVIRGRVRFGEQIRRRHGRGPPVEVRFDEFTDDIEENRLIRAAVDGLGRLRIRSAESRRGLRHIAGTMENVSLVHYERSRVPEITYTRLNAHYRGAVELARLILRWTSIDHRYGGVTSSTFLVDMNRLFEDFVRVALREALGVDESSFPQGGKGRKLWLDRARTISLEPDLSWWRHGQCVFVGDVKYKDLTERRLLNPDAYQMLAYTTALQLSEGLIVYAGTAERVELHDIDPGGKRIEVRTLDLTQRAPDLLAQVNRLADRVRRLIMQSSVAALEVYRRA